MTVRLPRQWQRSERVAYVAPRPAPGGGDSVLQWSNVVTESSSTPRWTSALRHVLEGFVAQGIDEVIAKVHGLDVMFA
jgi:hypothetical protein